MKGRTEIEARGEDRERREEETRTIREGKAEEEGRDMTVRRRPARKRFPRKSMKSSRMSRISKQ